MDIKSLYTLEAHESGSELNIISPINGKATECFLNVLGADSRVWREAELNGKRKILELFKAGESDSVKNELIIAETLATSVTGWRGFDNNGEVMEFDRSFLVDLFVNSPLIADQVNQFISNRANFTKG
tara:strand:- start:2534 stop:2917 length:384 start_codon:yes stop_codon:yes gene_type:complete